MKEILYIQAGELSNYTGTHFWNTQESYLTMNESRDFAGIDPGVAFCENIDDKVSVPCDISPPESAYTFIGPAHIMSSFDFNRQKMQVFTQYSTVNSYNLWQMAANFGTLARCNALGNTGEVPEELTESLWCDITCSVARFPV